MRNNLSAFPLALLLLLSLHRTVLTAPLDSDSVSEEDSVSVEEQDVAVHPSGVEEKNHDQPIWELQMAVWPHDDIEHEDNIGTIPVFGNQAVVYPGTIPTWQQKPQVVHVTQQKPQPQPTKPVAVVPIFPDIHFDELEAVADDVADDHVNVGGVVTPKPSVPVTGIEVVEQFQVLHPNGTTEYKLVLSNGMTNYKKIYNKLMPSGKIVTVQEGYDSVPIPGDDPYLNDYQTQYYISDEHGHNVYRVEKHTRRPKLPIYLNYKQQLGYFNKV